MRDYSFLRLKDNFAEANNIQDRSITEIYYYDFISLSPCEAYTQITNVSGGISFDADYTVEVIDCAQTVLKDITDRVFITEITGVDGNTQLKFEIINIDEDFYRKTVYLKISSNISDAVYYTCPINITDYQSNHTTFFKYKSYDNYKGIPYENAQCYQAIRLKTYFDIPIDESEISGYTQSSVNGGNQISARVIDILNERYQIDHTTRFGYDRLNVLLKHDIIYVDNIKMTNKAVAESNDMQGNSNVFDTTFTIAKNYDDVSIYEYQIFEGFKLVILSPSGSYTLAGLPTDIVGTFNNPITLNTGTLTLYDASDNSIIQTYTESDIVVLGSTFTIDFTGEITANGNYYIKFDSGLFSFIGIDFAGIDNATDWSFNVQDGDYLATDYLTADYLTA